MFAGLLTTVRAVVRGQRGNAMLQTAASLGALAILTATTGPMVKRYMDHARTLRARGEVRIVASTVQLLLNDLASRAIPEGPDSDYALDLLVSNGDVPQGDGRAVSQWLMPAGAEGVGNLNDYLLTNALGFPLKGDGGAHFGWDGPYLQTPLNSDPWGRRYAASVGLFTQSGEYVPVIVSAGPDGVMEVPYGLALPQVGQVMGDDIYHPLR